MSEKKIAILNPMVSNLKNNLKEMIEIVLMYIPTKLVKISTFTVIFRVFQSRRIVPKNKLTSNQETLTR